MTLLILALFIVATFAALRVYAIWNRNWQLALPVLLLGLVSPALNIVLDVAEAPVLAPPPSSGCGISLSISESLYSTRKHLLHQCLRSTHHTSWLPVIICNRATTSAYDGIVLVLTLARTYHLLMSDGTMYFALLLVINIAQIIITSRVSGSNYLSYFVSPFTSMLISRFLLDLRKVPSGESPMNPSASTMFVERPDLTTIVFEETGLSTFGAPLGSGSESVDFDGSENSDTEGISAEDSTPGNDIVGYGALLAFELRYITFHDNLLPAATVGIG
ncbi:hypothetical protein NM688_g5524 [Phlebia brevispora]|uniref:Uncharacterized protein n=1 Tax=Phlebia brevispora TaxID=194682 RepID=A0ACC1STY2_9APHY|nr:hypothetical protein NM688_g5524 [Phlebia brevispora]